MNISFENKKVLVTGAGQGIGKELAKAFVQCKAAKVFALSKTKANLEKLVKEESAIIPLCVDVNDWNSTRNAVQSLGPIDVLVNNAGIAIVEPFMEVTPEHFDSTINVNLKSVLNISQVVAKGMIANKSGVIINVSSQASIIALPNHATYSASKAALDSLTKSMAQELGPHNIRVNAVNPTVVMTEMGRSNWADPAKAATLLNRMPLKRFAEVEDVVNVILFLANEKSGILNALTVPIEGGLLAC